MIFHWYGLLIGIGILVAFSISQRFAKFFSFSTSDLEDAVLWIAIPAIFGARLYHVLTDWHLYSGRPFLETLAIWNGGLGIFGAIAGGLFGLLLFSWHHTKKQEKSFWTFFFSIADLFSVGIPIGQAVGRVGNFINQELYGYETTLPWGIWVEGKKYHPLFLYEGIFLLCLSFTLGMLLRNKALTLGKGQYVSLYLIGYGAIRFWLEFLRAESARLEGWVGIFSIAQWVCLMLMVGGSFLFWTRRHAPKKQFDLTLL